MSKTLFPGLSGYGISKSIFPHFVGLRKVKKAYFPTLSEDGMSNISPRFIGLRNVKSIIPRFVGLRKVKKASFPALSDDGRSKVFIPRFIGRRNVKHLSPFCRIRESQKSHSPLYRKTECQEYHSLVYWKMEYQEYHLPVCRITRCHSSQIPHSPQKCHPQCVWSSDVANQLFQVVSPKQWTTWVYLLSLFQVVSPKQWTAWVLPFVFVSSG